VASLRAHRERQERQLGALPGPSAFVFTTRLGTPLEARNIVRSFKAILVKAALPDKRFHDLRHSAGSFLIAQHVHPRVVMQILGHSQIGVTMNTYGHVLDETMKEAAAAMDDLFANG
jgi:integrase